VILVDTNVLMYAAGASHRCKAPSVRFLERVASGEVEAVVDVEVLQEILHRYRALGRWEDGRRLFDLTRALFPVVLPVTADVMDRARDILDEHDGLMARDGVHAAVVFDNVLGGICSFDRDFDGVAGLTRVEPGMVG
jgi:predicted nucleic acid-binding protein